MSPFYTLTFYSLDWRMFLFFIHTSDSRQRSFSSMRTWSVLRILSPIVLFFSFNELIFNFIPTIYDLTFYICSSKRSFGCKVSDLFTRPLYYFFILCKIHTLFYIYFYRISLILSGSIVVTNLFLSALFYIFSSYLTTRSLILNIYFLSVVYSLQISLSVS